MKPVLVIAVFGGFLLAGSGGYFLGVQNTKKAAWSNVPAGTDNRSDAKSSPTKKQDLSSSFSKDDIVTFKEKLNRQQNLSGRFKLAEKNLEAWTKSAPLDALAWLQGQPASAKRQDMIHKSFAQFAKQSPKDASAWAVENLRGDELNNALVDACEQWAKQDGFAAATWASSLPPGSERNSALEGVFCSWAAENPSDALGFLEKNFSTGELAGVLRQASYEGWAQSDPQHAVEASLQSSRQYKDIDLFSNTLGNWASIDVSSAAQWFFDHQSTCSAEEKQSAISGLCDAFAQESPEKGLAWVDTLPAGAERNAALNQFVSSWADENSTAAAKWLAGQDIGKLEPETVEQVLESFFTENPNGFEAWSKALPNGALKERSNHTKEAVETE